MVLSVMQATEVSKASRKLRYPQHRWQLRTKPWQIQPFMVAPVLPGETLDRMVFQTRAVSDPLANPILGWWKEYYWFYVKHRDLDARDLLVNMVLDPDTDISSLNEAASTPYYHFGPGPCWAKLALKRIVEEFFRNEDEAWDDYLVDGLPAAMLGINDWADSAMNAADMTAFDVDLDADADTHVMASEVEAGMRQYQLLRDAGLTTMTYEEYLQSYGVRPAKEELHQPELIRFVKDWTYPANTVDPATGTPSSAAVWSISDSANKSRFFKEPGWIVGVTVTRPKVYRSTQIGAIADAMVDAYSWVPSVLYSDAGTTWKQFDNAAGPLPNNADANGYWIDVKDLLMYGDQFINFSLSSTDAGLVAVPTTGMQKRYGTAAMAAALFADTDPGTAILIKEDGVASCTIKTHQSDTSPTR